MLVTRPGMLRKLCMSVSDMKALRPVLTHEALARLGGQLEARVNTVVRIAQILGEPADGRPAFGVDADEFDGPHHWRTVDAIVNHREAFDRRRHRLDALIE